MWPFDPSGSGHIHLSPLHLLWIGIDPSGSGHIHFSPLHLLWTGIGPSGSGHIPLHHRIHRGLELTQADWVIFFFTTASIDDWCWPKRIGSCSFPPLSHDISVGVRRGSKLKTHLLILSGLFMSIFRYAGTIFRYFSEIYYISGFLSRFLVDTVMLLLVYISVPSVLPSMLIFMLLRLFSYISVRYFRDIVDLPPVLDLSWTD